MGYYAPQKGRMASFEKYQPFDLRKMSFSKKKIFFPKTQPDESPYFSEEAILPFLWAECHIFKKIRRVSGRISPVYHDVARLLALAEAIDEWGLARGRFHHDPHVAALWNSLVPTASQGASNPGSGTRRARSRSSVQCQTPLFGTRSRQCQFTTAALWGYNIGVHPLRCPPLHVPLHSGIPLSVSRL